MIQIFSGTCFNPIVLLLNVVAVTINPLAVGLNIVAVGWNPTVVRWNVVAVTWNLIAVTFNLVVLRLNVKTTGFDLIATGLLVFSMNIDLGTQSFHGEAEPVLMPPLGRHHNSINCFTNSGTPLPAVSFIIFKLGR